MSSELQPTQNYPVLPDTLGNPMIRLVPDNMAGSSVFNTVCESRTIRVAGHSVSYTTEMPETVTDPNAAGIMPGFFGLEIAYAGLRHNIASAGRPAITVQQPRSSVLESLGDVLHRRSFLERQSDGYAAVFEDAHNTYGFESFVLACHSKGGKTAADMMESESATKVNSDRIKSTTFMATAGSDGSNLFTLSRRAPNYLLNEVSEELNLFGTIYGSNPGASIKQALGYFGNPLEIAIEGVDAANADLRPSLGRIRDSGTSTAALLLSKDSLFSAKEARERIQNHVDMTLELNLGHNAPITHPEDVTSALQAIWWHLDC